MSLSLCCHTVTRHTPLTIHLQLQVKVPELRRQWARAAETTECVYTTQQKTGLRTPNNRESANYRYYPSVQY